MIINEKQRIILWNIIQCLSFRAPWSDTGDSCQRKMQAMFIVEPGRKDLCIRFRFRACWGSVFISRPTFLLPYAARSWDVWIFQWIPQDGQNCLPEGQDCELRMSTLPVLYGESIAVRILRSHVPFIEKQELAWPLRQRQIILRRLRQKSGLILITDPQARGNPPLYILFCAFCAVSSHALLHQRSCGI